MPFPLNFRAVFAALESARVRYVAVGGIATVLRGVDRLTADIDLVIDLTPEHALLAIDTLTKLGMRSRVPVDPAQFADAEIRNSWIREKGMMVFNFWDPKDRYPGVDLFVEYPIDFEQLWKNSSKVDLGGMEGRIASIEHLIVMKQAAGRPKDLQDVELLEEVIRNG